MLVTYVFGSRLPAYGRCISRAGELSELNKRSDDLRAYIVEVCPGCSWHHLLRVIPVGGRKLRASTAT